MVLESKLLPEAKEAPILAVGHVRAIIKKLPQKPLHEIPLRDIAETLFDHLKVPSNTFLRQETARQLYCARLASRLKAEGLIQQRHVRLLKDTLGTTPYDTIQEKKRQLTAFEQLRRRLGDKQLGYLRVRAKQLLNTMWDEYKRTNDELSGDRDLGLKFPHTFGNGLEDFGHGSVLLSYK